MRMHTGTFGLALLTLALGACGSEKTNTTTTTTATFSPSQLSDALLTKSDLGTGWTETQRDVFTTRQPENPSVDPSLWCPAGKGDELVALAGQEGADVELSLGDTHSPFMVRQQAWANTDVQEYFTSVKAAVATCSGVTWNDSEGNSYTLQAAAAPEIGDESTSWKVTIQLTGATPTMSFAEQTAARFGDVMMVVQAGATPTTGATATAANYRTIVRVAGDKLAALVTP
jgi:hypothetical protein